MFFNKSKDQEFDILPPPPPFPDSNLGEVQPPPFPISEKPIERTKKEIKEEKVDFVEAPKNEESISMESDLDKLEKEMKPIAPEKKSLPPLPKHDISEDVGGFLHKIGIVKTEEEKAKIRAMKQEKKRERLRAKKQLILDNQKTQQQKIPTPEPYHKESPVEEIELHDIEKPIEIARAEVEIESAISDLRDKKKEPQIIPEKKKILPRLEPKKPPLAKPPTPKKEDSEDDTAAIQHLIQEVRASLMEFDLEKAKRTYIRAMEIYSKTTPENQVAVYNDLREIYDERKHAESVGNKT